MKQHLHHLAVLLAVVHSARGISAALSQLKKEDDDASSPCLRPSMFETRRQAHHSLQIDNAKVSQSTSVDHARRRQDEVETSTNSNCWLTTALKTPTFVRRGVKNAKGIMFTFQSVADVELLSLEFGTLSSSATKVEVYIRQGSFSGLHSAKSQWTSLANVQAEMAPDSKTAIIPAHEFQSYSIQANTEYALYVSMSSSGVLQVQESPGLIGSELNSNGVVKTNVGVLLTDGPFPATLGSSQGVDFQGVLHYRQFAPCNNLVESTTVDLDFAINSDPTGQALSLLSQRVQNAAVDLLNSDSTLLHYKSTKRLVVQQVKSNFVGRSVEKCPSNFERCALLTSSVTFQHSISLENYRLEKDVITVGGDLGEDVAEEGNFEVQYVGLPVTAEKLIFSVDGISQTMTEQQVSYFERVSSEFLNLFSTTIPVYQIEVVDQSLTTRRLDSQNIRGRQLASILKVSVYAYGSGSSQEVRTAVADIIGSNTKRYVDELALQHLRPGHINNNGDDLGFAFNSLSDVQVSVTKDHSSSHDSAGAENEDSTVEPQTESLWLPLCITGVTISIAFLIIRIYFDCFHSPKISSQKLKRGHDSERSTTSSDSIPSTGKMKRSQSGGTFRQMSDSLVRREEQVPTSSPVARAFQQSKASQGCNHGAKSTARKGRLKRAHSDDQVRQMSESLAKRETTTRNRAGETGRGITLTRSLSMGSSEPFGIAEAHNSLSNQCSATTSSSQDKANPKRSVQRSNSLPMGNPLQHAINSKDGSDSRSVSELYSSGHVKSSKKSKKKKLKRALSPKRQKKLSKQSPKKKRDLSRQRNQDTEVENPILELPKRKQSAKKKRDNSRQRNQDTQIENPILELPKRKQSPKKKRDLSPKTNQDTEVESPVLELPKRKHYPKRKGKKKTASSLSPKRKVVYQPKNKSG
eukprot:scaffold1778_cov101-Cylindrotheca_fusiformis.AAC.5